ncbi:MAG: carbamoyltransferase [Gammaproteobacteria bacterium]
MHDRPLVLGINRTQDASACLMHGSDIVWAVQKERLTRHKHHWGRLGDVRDHYGRLPGFDRPVDVVVECFSSDAEFTRRADYESELQDALPLSAHLRRARISHHLAHVYSAFPPSPFDEAAVMVIDGQGSAVADFTEGWPGAGEPEWLEVASFYVASRRGVKCIGKQLWSRDEGQPAGLGMFYFLLTQAIFPGEGNEGKVMGLAPHGDAEALGLPPLEVGRLSVHIPAPWLRTFADKERFRYRPDDRERFTQAANLAAAGQRAFEAALLELGQQLHAHTGVSKLCFGGGTALNCPGNEQLWRRTPFDQVFVPPAPSDAGTAIGCAAYGLLEVAEQECHFRWTHDYLGPDVALGQIEAALADAPDLIVGRICDTNAFAARVAGLLAEGNVVAMFHGASEFGPRALGHRSILADPRSARMRDWINAEVKQREWFRPLAPVVLEEHAADYFELDHPSPFMQFAVPATPACMQHAPAVVHVDGTARVQTVGRDGDPLLRGILHAFKNLTGVPVLLNTSLNRKDEPIVETPEQCLATFRTTPMQVLAIGPFLALKRSAGQVPDAFSTRH